MANTAKKSSSTTKTKVNEDVKKEKDYSAEIEELKKMVEMLSLQNKELMKQKDIREFQPEERYVNINETLNPARMIKVVSLCSNELNLSQYEHGTGKVYKFAKLGVSRNIPANILDDIVSTHITLAEKGYFYICDETFVREHGLEADYSNLKDANVIDTLFKQDKNFIKQVLSSCKITQLDTILDIIAQKVLSNEITLEELEDTGKVALINKIYKDRKGNGSYDFREVVEGLQAITQPIKK